MVSSGPINKNCVQLKTLEMCLYMHAHGHACMPLMISNGYSNHRKRKFMFESGFMEEHNLWAFEISISMCILLFSL